MQKKGVAKRLLSRLKTAGSEIKNTRPVDFYDGVVFAFVRVWRFVMALPKYSANLKSLFARRNFKRTVIGFNVLLAVFVVSVVAFNHFFKPPQIFLSEQARELLPQQKTTLSDYLQLDPAKSTYKFNENYGAPNRSGLSGAGQGNPRVIADLGSSSEAKMTITDPVSGAKVSLTPRFEVKSPTQDENQLFYKLTELDGYLVYTTTSIGVKEDIVLNSYASGELILDYKLEMDAGLEPRLETNGSIAFYGVTPTLLGDVSTGSEEDAALLDEARKNGEKNNLLFTIPAPIAIESGKSVSDLDMWFELEGNNIRLVTRGLKAANYPLTIDPSIYVETAAKLMRGNNETNVDFDVANELIQKGSTTGARFDEWTSDRALNGGRFDGASAIAGGYMYHIGGVDSSGTPNTTTFSTAGSDTFSVPAGVTSITVKAWGAGGGGGGGGTSGVGGDGGGAGYSTSVLTVTPSETLNVVVGGGGGAGDFSTGTSGSLSGDGGGGGGHSEVNRSGTALVVAAGGGGGGGGDNSASTAGGDGGEGGGSDDTDGANGNTSSNAGGGGGGTASAGGAGGTGGGNAGSAGGSESGGDGADGRSGAGADGSKNNGGTNAGGDGGNGDQNANGYAAGGGGGGGYYGGGGGSGSQAGDAGGGGGGGGSNYTTGSSQTKDGGAGTVPGNSGDSSRAGAGDGGTGGATSSSGTDGDDGLVEITYYTGVTDTVEDSVQWAEINSSTGALDQPNPGNGTCTNWCNESVYDLPDERRGHSLVAYNGFLYVIGGEDSTGTRQSTIYISKLGANGEPSLWHPTDPDKANWAYWYEDTSLADATSYLAATAYNNRIYILGGQTNASTGGTTTVQYADFQPNGTLSTLTTTGMLSLPTNRHGHAVQVYNDYLYLIGGANGNTPLATNYYVRLDTDGTMLGSWEQTSSFNTARSTAGGSYSSIFGAYIYVMGGCSSISSGICQVVDNSIELASINADGSINEWEVIDALSNQRAGYGLHTWNNYLYRLGGCSGIDTGSGECSISLSSVDRAEINPPGEVSTVSITESSGNGNCTGGNPYDCDLPSPAGDDAGEIGHMLNASIVLNGYLYVIGGCTDYTCNGSTPQPTDVSGNVAYVAIAPDGTLEAPSSCSGTSYGSWCVDSTNRVNGTAGVAAAGVAVFNNTMYVVGGLDGSGNINEINRNTVNADGSLSGAWTSQSLTGAGGTSVAYTYAYARANPSSADTNPGNLYIFGGCSTTTSAGCSGYTNNVYKCNIQTSGAISGCTTTGQLQIDSDPDTTGDQGLGIHSGTVYANYIYLVGGVSETELDKDEVIYAQFDDSNNVVAVSGSEWVESPNTLTVGRRRGWAFGYNGHIYSMGGYDAGEGVLPFIEWAKINVSDGSIDSFVTSTITINQRWGLSAAVSNSYAYVIGGCDVGASPGGCSSFEPSLQTFQLYNNDSGAQGDYTASSPSFANTNNRIGASATVLDGYIYVAGGENSSTVTDNVQVGLLSANGTISDWDTTTADLPAARAYGQLEAAGGSLYYIGGEDTAGDEKSEVYYATPVSKTTVPDKIRTTQYKIAAGEYDGANYTLTLNNDLQSDYFAIVSGSNNQDAANGARRHQVRVDGDPFGNLTATTNSDEIRLERGQNNGDWVGSITVVECISSCTTDGFELSEVLDVTLAEGSGNTLQTTDVTLAANHSTQTVPFGGYLGGGLSTSTNDTAEFGVTAGVRIRKNSTDEIRLQRYGGGNEVPRAADVTVYVVEWGSNWDVEEVDFNDWDEGGDGVDATNEYTTQAITTVNRDETWVWKSPGHSDDERTGLGAFGTVLTLGDGVNQNATESEVALASDLTGATRNDTVYVLEHADLVVDYRFKSESVENTNFTMTVDAPLGAETSSVTGNITTISGFRVPLLYEEQDDNDTDYPSVAGWSMYHSGETEVSFNRAFDNNDGVAGWLQSIDFANFAGQGVDRDITTWSTATNGLPADRTRHGAAVWNDRLYVVGGLDDSNTESTTVYISPQQSSGGDITGSWTTETTNVPDVARSGGAVIAYANNLYYLGGNDGSDYLSDVQFTQINTDGSIDAWTFTTNLPRQVSDADGFAVNGFMYLIGGRSAASTCTNNTYVAPMSANTTIATGNNPTGIGEWYQTNVEYTGDRRNAAVTYYRGKTYVLGGGCSSELTSNQHWTGAVQSQPQVARYSRMIDTDTDVFPTKWLLNGLDNSIGARWEVKYRSAVDNDFEKEEKFEDGTEGSNVDTADTVYDDCYRTGAMDIDFDDAWAAAGTQSAYFFTSTTGTAGCLYNFEETSERYERFYLNLNSNPITNTGLYSLNNTTGNGTVAEVQVTSAGELRLRDRFTATGSLMTLDSTSAGNRIEIGVFNDQMTVRVYRGSNVNGNTPDETQTIDLDDPTADDTFDQTNLGALNNVALWDFWIDEHVSSATGWIGTAVPAPPQWGVETDFGEVTLGQPEDYNPLNPGGDNTAFARYYYFTVEIDSSRTYGYPDDVTRGPTIDDLTLFFTSDPSKRLRHGKTFTGGEQQPLDTPF